MMLFSFAYQCLLLWLLSAFASTYDRSDYSQRTSLICYFNNTWILYFNLS